MQSRSNVYQAETAVEVFGSGSGLAREHLGAMRTTRCTKSAERFRRQTLNASHTQSPRGIKVDNNAAYPAAVDDIKADEQLPETTKLPQVKYLNNRVELSAAIYQTIDSSGNGFGSFNTARRTLSGLEAMNMIRKGQFSCC